ncbi:hypothetical protein E1162_09270 [Rhodobacteraceae bacterium RKSG542]|uniref:RNase H family protein n=1 Tax=Pseudovibrio flavus TaxID=2529854 RepID=UPI0012BCA866|nr:hypothetical protein [Pseudovibrio flavus]
MHHCANDPAHLKFVPYYTVYCGHSCDTHSKPSIGGHVAIFDFEGQQEFYGGHIIDSNAPHTALIGVIKATKHLPDDGKPALILTSSGYVVEGIESCKGPWPQRHWKNVKNPKEWQLLYGMGERRDIFWCKPYKSEPCKLLLQANEMAKKVVNRERKARQ